MPKIILISRRLLNMLPLCFVLLCLNSQATAAIRTATLSFYSESIELSYDESMLLNERISITEEGIIDFYKKMEQQNYGVLLDDLLAQKNTLGLNDWLYYELLDEAVDEIFVSYSPKYRTLVNWLLLVKSDFDARLGYWNNEAFLYVYSEDEIFEAPIFVFGKRSFVNLSYLKGSKQMREEIYTSSFVPNSSGHSFSFKLDKLPQLKGVEEEKYLSFNYQDKTYDLKASMDKTLVDLMEEYPLIDESYYLETPLSSLFYESLVPEFKRIMQDMSEQEKVECLLAFTRTAFNYKDDKIYFGKGKPMIPDEVLYYRYSDCEDRSALFYSLAKELLDLPMIIVVYPDHMTIGVKLAKDIGKPFYYKGRSYTNCDPTGPENSWEMGIYPEKYERKNYEVLGSYKH